MESVKSMLPQLLDRLTKEHPGGSALAPVTSSRALSEFEPKQIEWLWMNRIPVGSVTLLEGDGGIGKSFVIASIGAAVTRGCGLPEGINSPPGSVLIFAAEDDPEVVLRPRFESHGADLSRVFFFTESIALNHPGLLKMESEIQVTGSRLVVIDPIMAFVGTNVDTGKAADVRAFMKPLNEIAKRNNCAVLVVRHWTKNTTASSSHRGAGSVDFRNAARSVLQIMASGEQRYLALGKSNYSAMGGTLLFQIKEKKVVWTGSDQRSADQLIAELGSDSAERSELGEAMEFLKNELAGGPVPSVQVIKSAREFGLSDATLRRARIKLGIKPYKVPGQNQFIQALPVHAAHGGDDAHQKP